MNSKSKFPLPVSLIVIDAVGAMLVAWGFYLYVSEDRGIVHIAAGFILMMPLVVHILNRAQFKKNKLQGGKHDGRH